MSFEDEDNGHSIRNTPLHHIFIIIVW